MEAGKDCILICAQEPNRPALRLDDLAVAYKNVTAGGARPACTIDPRAEALKRLAEVGQSIVSAKDQSVIERQLEEWKKAAGAPQDVKVFGVEPATPFAKTMVDADYRMKTICNGVEPLKEVVSFTDLVIRRIKSEIEDKGKSESPMEFYNRFWFNAGEITYRSDGGLFLLSKCQVVLLTEQEAITQEGKRTGAAKANPFAKEFAEQFTAKFDEVSKVKPIYRELENLYRAVGATVLMDVEAGALGVRQCLNGSLGQVEVTKERFTDTLPGKYGLKKVQGTVPGGMYVLWLPSCGGVSIDITMNHMKKEGAPPGPLREAAKTIQTKRPGRGAVTWRFHLGGFSN